MSGVPAEDRCPLQALKERGIVAQSSNRVKGRTSIRHFETLNVIASDSALISHIAAIFP
jgi:hypothetical protein